VAGDRTVGEAFLRAARPLLFTATPGALRADIRAVKERIEGRLRRRGTTWGDVKSGMGSIRDVEFVVQFLQLLHGERVPQLLTTNTLEALALLARHRLLAPDDHRALWEGYTFMRPVEHYLQLMHGRHAHALPHDRDELGEIARRLGFRGDTAPDELVARYEAPSAAVRAVFERVLSAEGTPMSEPTNRETSGEAAVDAHVAHMAFSYRQAFPPQEIARHAQLVDRLDADDNLAEVVAERLGEHRWRVLVVAHDCPGELSLICGLLFLHGLSIEEGHAFTYEPASGRRAAEWRPVVVDTFTVTPTGELAPDVWTRYTEELNSSASCGWCGTGARPPPRATWPDGSRGASTAPTSSARSPAP